MRLESRCVALALSTMAVGACGAASPRAETPGGDGAGGAGSAGRRDGVAAADSVCAASAVLEPPLVASDELTLDVSAELVEAHVSADFRAHVTVPEWLDLELHRPDGTVYRQSFQHANYGMACVGCDPSGDGADCSAACSMESSGPAHPEVPHEVINQYGRYTALLVRRSTGARVSQRFTVESSIPYGNDPVCTDAPEHVGPYRRTGCGAGVIPVDLGPVFGATQIEYRSGACVVHVLLRIAHVGGASDDSTPYIFARSALGHGRAQRYAEGSVRASVRNGRELVAWLGPWLAVVEAPRVGPTEQALVRALLTQFPSVAPSR